eukprot:TRINITY_DN3181_c0_g1_i1.p1 TRINITY_DN3181_c0_g1~~TRINITY_DN3181_c0_g1_i1.p1  ORF type:complete len:371 (+),score=49.59 TRINITY_DN3181_c0_g1_i1:48-1160(+)
MDFKRTRGEDNKGEDAKRMRDSNNRIVRTAINPVYVFSQLIQGCSLLSFLPLQTILQLTLVCKEMGKLVISYIERNYSFNMCGHEFKEFSIYKPISVTVDSFFSFQTITQSFPSITKIKLIFHQNRDKIEYLNALIDSLSPNVTQLEFDGYFNSSQAVNVVTLASHITHLKFSNSFNQPIENLPRSVSHLTFGEKWDKPVENFPPNIIHLIFGQNFRHPVDGLLPQKIRYLTFGVCFNEDVKKLPLSVLDLKLGYFFNRPLDSLPLNLKYLEVGNFFDQPLKKLPNSLTHLKLGFYYNHPLDALPANLTHLSLGSKFCKPILRFPPKLSQLILGSDFDFEESRIVLLLLKNSGCKIYVRVEDKLKNIVWN